VAVQTLTDAATSVLPLEHAPVARHPRLGPITYRAELVSSGQTPPRIDRDEFGEPVEERHPSIEDIARALLEIGLDDLIATRDLLRAADAALTLMRDITREKVGHRAALDFRDREGSLQPRVSAMALWLDHHVALRDPARALAPQPSQQRPGAAPDAEALAQAPGLAAEAAGPGAAPPVATLQDAAAALAAIDAYFAQREPSNPALLLVRQAAQLAGKSYLDALRTLAPDFTGAARIALGRIDGLAMQVESFADFALVEPTGEASTTIYAPASRADAVALMGAVVAYFSRNEPSSPTPLLLERAQKMCGKDFLSILREMLPPDALKV
jgi:type VI secretion system protein ImpA